MSIRLRLALVFAGAAALLFGVGGWIFASRLASSLLATTDVQLASVARSAAPYLASKPPGEAALAGVPSDYVLQLVDATGRVRRATSEARGAPILDGARLAAARSGALALTVPFHGEALRVWAEPLAGRPGWVVLAGLSTERYHQTMAGVDTELAAAGVLFVVAAAVGAYALAGAALRPVERLRREVAGLSVAETSGSVRVPGTHDEIAALAATMNDLLRRVDDALDRERNLVADASHELRSPFAVLSAELELAGRPGRSADELRTAVRSAAEEAGRLARITDDLLFLARSDRDTVAARRRPTDLAQLLFSSARRAEARAAAAGVTCRVQATPGVTADVDADNLGRAIDNLVDNALRFAPPGTAIVLRADAAGDGALLSVTDRGPGFPPEFLPFAFERFRRPDPSRSREDGGAGLGLAIVKAVAVAHGGSVAATNEGGGGARVEMRLPGAVRLR